MLSLQYTAIHQIADSLAQGAGGGTLEVVLDHYVYPPCIFPLFDLWYELAGEKDGGLSVYLPRYVHAYSLAFNVEVQGRVGTSTRNSGRLPELSSYHSKP